MCDKAQSTHFKSLIKTFKRHAYLFIMNNCDLTESSGQDMVFMREDAKLASELLREDIPLIFLDVHFFYHG